MAYSNVQYVGNGVSKTYYIPFQYLAQSHVKISSGGTLLVNGVDYTWTSSNAVTLTLAPAMGVVVDISRSSSPTDRLVDFQDGSTLTQEILDLNSDQLFYLSQENIDGFDKTLTQNTVGVFDAKNKRITNVATAVNANDAVTKQTIDTVYPAVNTVAASISNVNIVGADLGSTFGHVTDLGSITESTTPTPTVPSRIDTIITNLSDIHTVANNITPITSVAGDLAIIEASPGYASSASTSATNAATSATNAASSATNALASKDAAAGSATSAATSATNAATSATASATSSSNAASSATSASGSASTATTKASDAASSATAAATSAISASTFASSASGSSTAAASSATAASGSASSASTSATNAANSASSASTSATNAASSATSASTSASTATTQAGVATTQATNAATSATAAAAAQAAAETARDQTLAAYDSFDDRYLGTKASDPALDNDGNPLVAGALYFNSTSGGMKVYTGSAWVAAYASLSGALLTSNNLSDLTSVTTARSNLGLATVASSGSYADLTGKPTAVSSFTNDSGYVTQAGARTAISATGSLSYNSTTGVVSYTAPTLAPVATTGAYSDLTGKPTVVSSFTNDAAYITQSDARSAISVTGSLSYNSTTGVVSYTAPTLATVATTGSYTDLANKPTLGSLAAKNTVAVTDLATTLDLGTIP